MPWYQFGLSVGITSEGLWLSSSIIKDWWLSKESLIYFGVEGGSGARRSQARWSWVGSPDKEEFLTMEIFELWTVRRVQEGERSWEANALCSHFHFYKRKHLCFSRVSCLLLMSFMRWIFPSQPRLRKGIPCGSPHCEHGLMGCVEKHTLVTS
jgi:hypothetical protein